MEAAERLLFGHGEVIFDGRSCLVAPCGVNVIAHAVQYGDRPHMIPVLAVDGAAVDTLQFEQEVICRGVSVADGETILKRTVGTV